MNIAIASIASNRRMALARSTAVSLSLHHPELPFFVLQADAPHAAVDPAREPFRLLSYAGLGAAVPQWLHFHYGEQELTYALTPFLLRHLLETGFDAVLFLKQETMVLGRLDPLLEMLARHSVVLTPHLLEPPRGRQARLRELNVLRAGIFNGGVVGFRRTAESLALLDWWARRCACLCRLDVENGLHFEQRWLDFFPSLAPGLGIVRDPGINVGHWNLPERRIEIRNGQILACGLPCRIFRFSGYDPARPGTVSRYRPDWQVADTGPAAEVFRRYQALLEQCGWRECAGLPYGWDLFDNGEPIPLPARRLHSALGEAAAQFGDPFAAGAPGSYYSWLRKNHPRLFRELR
ncbi:MAG: hypothetical protein NZR01_16485 [Bryobacteraceae bacterium]|nr:hypothetical protein [Bryobacteraceae bacterium]